MHINSLPSDVLFAILKPICEVDHLQIFQWARRLNVLAVCRKWRQLALPMLYKMVSINYLDTIWTNLDLITEEMSSYPRIITIWIDSRLHHPEYILQIILQRLNENRIMFPRVSHLFVDVHFPKRGENNCAQTFREIATQLKSLLPRVSSLHCKLKADDDDILVLETTLIGLYASQLKRIAVDSSALTKETAFTELLSDLRIWGYKGSAMLTTINVDSLTRLELDRVGESFNWAAFATNEHAGEGALYFPVLEHMVVNVQLLPMHFNDGDVGHIAYVGPANRFGYRLEAPRLRIIKVHICAFTCSLLASIDIPKKLEQLEFIYSDDTNYTFYEFSMSDAAQRVFENYYNSSQISSSIVSLVNDLQSVDDSAQHRMQISLGAYFPAANVQSIYWPHVTHLSIDLSISLTEVLMLVESKLHNLLSLNVYRIKVKELSYFRGTIPELENTASISPIKCKIKSLVYGFGPFHGSIGDMCREFEQFITSVIESLEYVNFKQ